MLINVDPTIAQAFNNTNYVSTSKGKGAMLLKAGSKRRRTKAEIAEAKQHELEKEDMLANQTSEIEQLRKALEAKHRDDGLKQQAFEFVSKEIDKGNIELDGDGNVLPLHSQMNE